MNHQRTDSLKKMQEPVGIFAKAFFPMYLDFQGIAKPKLRQGWRKDRRRPICDQSYPVTKRMLERGWKAHTSLWPWIVSSGISCLQNHLRCIAAEKENGIEIMPDQEFLSSDWVKFNSNVFILAKCSYKMELEKGQICMDKLGWTEMV